MGYCILIYIYITSIFRFLFFVFCIYFLHLFQWNICKDLIAARGPDYLAEKHILLNHDWHGYFASSVLWMQGSEMKTQPSLDHDDNLLLWNGDLFSGCLVYKFD